MNEKEKKVFAPEAYFVAAFGLALMDASADEVKSLNRQGDFSRLFQSVYNREIGDDILSETLHMMDGAGLLKIDTDVYAGEFITAQKTAFVSQYKILAEQLPDSPLAIALRGKRVWIDNVFSSSAFWKEVYRPVGEHGEASEKLEDGEDIPASDRMVTLLHNSPERVEIEDGIQQLSDVLRTNNEVAAELGDDRERLAAELEAAKTGIRPEKIRAGFIRDTVLRVLRELGTKLKDKAIELGVDRLITLFEILLDNVF